jgi:hypothetical protein
MNANNGNVAMASAVSAVNGDPAVGGGTKRKAPEN